MLEGWTTLGFMAAHSTRARLGLMVGGIHYRQPGLWVKATTTLDVLSGGRGLVRHRRGLEREESRGARLPVPAARRPVRAARGHPPDGPRDVSRASREPTRRSMAATSTRGACSTRRRPIPAPRTDHDRRRRRAEDAPPGGPVRRCHQRLRGRPPDRPQVRASCASTASGSGATYDEIERTTLQDLDLAAGGRRPGLTTGPDRRTLRRAGRRRRPARHRDRPRPGRSCPTRTDRARRDPSAAHPVIARSVPALYSPGVSTT